MRRSVGPVLAVMLGAITSCSGDAVVDTPPTREIVNGVETVYNWSPQWTPREAWSFRERFRVGLEDSDLIADRAALAFGPDGTLAVLDMQSSRVRLYDSLGTRLADFGREGQGPGELRDPFSMGWDGAGRLWVANTFDGRFNVFDASGSFIKSVARPIRGANALISQLVFTEDGAMFWDERNLPDGAPSPFLIDTAGVVLDSTASIPHNPFPAAARAIPMRRGSAFRTLVDSEFLSRVRWSIRPNGERWSGGVGDTRLLKTTPEGDTLLIVHREHASRPLEGHWARLVAQVEREFGADPTWFERPLVQGIAVTPDGHVLISIVDEPNEEGSTLEVYSQRGVYLGAIDLGLRIDRIARMATRDGRLAVVARGDMDVPVVVVGRLIRPE